MPAYNAAKTLKKTLNDLPKNLADSIILVDDGSQDSTVKIAKKLGLKTFFHPQNRGYGANQKTCYTLALNEKADVVVMIHPDYQYDSSLTGDLIKPVLDGRFGIVLGSRIRTRREAIEGGMPLYKYFGNRILTLIENITLGQNLSEYHSGFRAFSAKLLSSVPFHKFSDDFAFDQEILIYAIKKGYRIGEIAVPVRYFPESSSINFTRSIKYGLTTLLLLLRYGFFENRGRQPPVIRQVRLKTPSMWFLVLTIFLIFFFSFRLGSVPSGINVDEAAYGYNGILLANFLHDQNNRFLPLFILGSDGVTWYPPYMQYMVAALFKLFGPSVFMMRFPNVLLATVSALLTFYLAKLLFQKKGAILALTAFLITPEVLIETHTALEHIIVLPFLLILLISLYKYKLSLKSRWLVLGGLSLGTGLYSYAGFRPLASIWVLISLSYIFYLNLRSHTSFAFKKTFKPISIFLLAVSPFFAVIPLLETRFPGAMLNRVTFEVSSIYSFFYYFLASFDLSFLFVTGDKLLVQSTLRHGMFLLSSLPFFALGLYRSFRNGDYFVLLGLTFFLSPLLFGFVGSAFFAHRLMYMIPFYCLFFAMGVIEVFKNRLYFIKGLGVLLVFIIALNFTDFWRYYLFNYPKDTYHIFHHIEDYEKPYLYLYKIARTNNLEPFMSKGVARLDKINISDVELFTRAIYFPKPPTVLENENDLPASGLLLSEKSELSQFKRLDLNVGKYFLYTSK